MKSIYSVKKRRLRLNILLAIAVVITNSGYSSLAFSSPEASENLYRITADARRFFAEFTSNGEQVKVRNNSMAFQESIYVRCTTDHLDNLIVFSDNEGTLKRNRYTISRVHSETTLHHALLGLQALDTAKKKKAIDLDSVLKLFKVEDLEKKALASNAATPELLLQVMHLAALQQRSDIFTAAENIFNSIGFESYRLARLRSQLMLQSGDLQSLERYSSMLLQKLPEIPTKIQEPYANSIYYYNTMARMLLSPTPKNLEELSRVINLRVNRSLLGKDLSILVDWLGAEWSVSAFKGEHEHAVIVAREAMAYAMTSGLQGKLLDLRNNLAVSLMALGRVAEARVQMGLAHSLAEEYSDTTSLANFQFNMAELHRRLGDPDQSRYYLNKARQHFVESGAISQTARVDLKIGSLDRRRGKPGGALKLWHDDRSREALSSQQDRFTLHLEVVEDLIALNRADEAAQELASLRQSPPLLHHQRLDTAIAEFRVLQGLGDPADTRMAAANLETLNAEKGRRLPFRKIKALSLLMNYYYTTGDQKRSRDYANQVTALIEDISENMLDIAYRDDWSRAVSSSVDLITGIFSSRAMGTKNAVELFEVLERIYTVRPSQEGRTHSVDLDKLDHQALERSLWGKLRASESARLYGAASTTDAYLGALKDTREKYSAIRLSVSAPLKLPSPAVSLEDLQQNIPESHLILRYYINQNRSFLLAIRKSTIEYIDLPGLAYTEQVTREVREDLQASSARLNKGVGLRDLIPIDHLLTGVSRIVIIGDDQIHRLPLEAASIKGALGLRYEFVRTFSATEYYTSAAQTVGTLKDPEFPTFTVFTDPLFRGPESLDIKTTSRISRSMPNEFLPALPYTKLEFEAIRDNFSGARIRSFSGSAATSANLTNQESLHSRVLHIASHGFQESAIDGFAGIHLAPSGENGANSFITVDQLLAKKLGTELVVVSGCETMLGTDQIGRGMNSLVRGLASQGARGVMATLWSVSDRGAAKFMRYFYEELAKSPDSVEEALLRARQISARTQPLSDWAAFTLTATHKKVLRASLAP